MKRLAAVCLALLLMMGCMTINRAEASGQMATVRGGWLRLRQTASYEGYVLGRYNTGAKVTVLGSHGEWYRVRTADGKVGYMLSAYLVVDTPVIPSYGTGETRYITSSNGQGVRLRSGPGTSYSVLGLYSVGTQVTVLNQGASWSYISIGGRTGYMMTQYLTAGYVPPTSAPSTSITAYVTSKNGRSVNLRAGASSSYRVIADYAVGTRVTIHNLGSRWCQVTIGKTSGYMKTEFLTNMQATVTSANGGNVAVRRGPGKGYTMLTAVNVGVNVRVITYGADWCCVGVDTGYGHVVGYMMTKYLRIK